ncbi:MAG: hypothetical protein R2685_09850 [Candidatus Nitrosocosmicus sp.]|nr:hypothetical protein [Candidatus Nitrosocosmicus sp.]
MNIEKNIDFILAHFDKSNLFPRKMMTKTSNGQVTVYSKKDVISLCKESDYIDCRVNAYPFYQTTTKQFSKLCLLPSPDFVFIDLDQVDFERNDDPKRILDKTLKNTLEHILVASRNHPHFTQNSQTFDVPIQQYENDKMNSEVKPTVLWTGNGYHIYLPIQSLLLDAYEPFYKENYPSLFAEGSRYFNRHSVSELFLEYAEHFFTNGNADSNHKPTFKSCLIRIPETFNSKCLYRGYNKEESKVKIIQEWNGHRLPIQLLTKGFRRWLLQLEVDQYRFMLKYMNNHNHIKTTNYIHLKNDRTGLNQVNKKIRWIENLLSTPVSDNRKFCIWRIFLPYLLNIRKLTVDETVLILKKWLNKCSQLKKLDFNPLQKIHECIRYVRNYLPPSKYRLRLINHEIYKIVEHS